MAEDKHTPSAPTPRAEPGREPDSGPVGARAADQEQLTGEDEINVGQERGVHDIEKPLERGA